MQVKKLDVWKAALGLAFRQPSFHVIPFGHVDGNTPRAIVAREGSIVAIIKARNIENAR